MFASCENIRVVWVEDCSSIEDVRRDNDWVAVLPVGLAMGSTLAQKIGDQWFKAAGVKSVVAPAGVREIGE